jgi:creatinine deaminase
LDMFMKAAIEEARAGLAEGGIPIGSALEKDGKIVGRGHNMRVQLNDPILHAEIQCLRSAGRLGSYGGTTLFSTLMPCHLCAGAIIQFRIPRLVVGEAETFSGARDLLLARGVQVEDLDLRECKAMMRTFIRKNPLLWDEDIGRL